MTTSTHSLIREDIEWCRIWVPNSAEPTLPIPRILLIGDSIVMAYGPKVSQLLAGRASVAWLGTSRFPSDPVFREEILLVLRHTAFDLVHFNNGLHGFDNSDESYAASLPEVLAEFRDVTPKATWLLANSTPMRMPGQLDEWHPRSERIRLRNGIMQALAEKEGLPLTDLFSVVKNHPEFYDADGTHFNETGQAAQAGRVTEAIGPRLTPIS